MPFIANDIEKNEGSSAARNQLGQVISSKIEDFSTKAARYFESRLLHRLDLKYLANEVHYENR